MDEQRARELLAAERGRIERELAALEREAPLGGSDRSEPGDEGSENLYEDEVRQGRREELRDAVAAVARAAASWAEQQGRRGASPAPTRTWSARSWRASAPTPWAATCSAAARGAGTRRGRAGGVRTLPITRPCSC